MKIWISISILNLEFIAHTKFFDFQDEFFNAAIESAFKSNIATARREVEGEQVVVCGDGSWDVTLQATMLSIVVIP